LHIRLVSQRQPKEMIDKLPLWCRVAAASNQRSPGAPEIEIAFAGAGGQFSAGCNCRLLVVPRGQATPPNLVSAASLVFSDTPIAGAKPDVCSPLRDFDAVLQRQLGCVATTATNSRRLAAV